MATGLKDADLRTLGDGEFGENAPKRRGAAAILREIGAALLLVAITIGGAYFLPGGVAGGLLLIVVVVFAVRKVLFSWSTALTILVFIIMLVPLRRYGLPLDLGFSLEPYRAVMFILIALLLLSLLIDQKPPWRPIVFGWPIAAFLLSLWISIVANGESLVASGLAMRAALALLEFVFFLSVFFIARIILSSETLVMRVLIVMAWCAIFVAVFAVIERATTWNIFLSLHTFLPLDQLRGAGAALRAGAGRAYGSAQHPIALGVALTMMLPIVLYLGKYSSWPRNEISRITLYGFGSLALLLGVVVAVSRTSIVVLAAMFLVTLILVPRVGVLLAMIGVPVFLLGAVLVPDVYNETVWSLFDFDSLVASQQTSPGWRGAGRLADVGPALKLIAQDPYFGSGVGSRITVGDDANSFILDNQFLATLLETGAIGVVGLFVMFLAPAIMLIVFAFSARVERRYAMLAFAIAISTIGYVAALFFYDAFAFMQTLMIELLLLAVGAWTISEAPRIVDAKPGESSADRKRATELDPEPSVVGPAQLVASQP